MASGLLASQQQLGADWLNVYLVSPLWRFVLAAGVCGPDALAGVLMPSIDRVGRYFPLTVAQPLDPGHALTAVLGGADSWFEQVETLLLATLEEGAGFEVFDQGVEDLGGLPFATRCPPATSSDCSAWPRSTRRAVSAPWPNRPASAAASGGGVARSGSRRD
ncbi:Protein phosphatase ImpM [Pseudomonas sp. FEN]|nr:Protein phosphatase ImpM [Pseudomonas sp. FEN]